MRLLEVSVPLVTYATTVDKYRSLFQLNFADKMLNLYLNARTYNNFFVSFDRYYVTM